MTTKEEVKQIAGTKILKFLIIAFACLSANAYFSNTPWLSVALYAIGGVCLITTGYVLGIVSATESLTK